MRHELEAVDVERALIRRHGCFTIVPYGLSLEEIRQGRTAARRITDPPLRQMNDSLRMRRSGRN